MQSTYTSGALNQKLRPQSLCILAGVHSPVNGSHVESSSCDDKYEEKSNKRGSMSLRKRSSQLLTSFPSPTSTRSHSLSPARPSQQPPFSQLLSHHYTDSTRPKSLMSTIKPQAPSIRRGESFLPKLHIEEPKLVDMTEPEYNALGGCEKFEKCEKCEHHIHILRQQLAESTELVEKLRECLQISKIRDLQTPQRQPNANKRTSYAITITEADTKSGLLEEEEEEEEDKDEPEVQDWGFCYVDQSARMLTNYEESGASDPGFASGLGFNKPMTAKRRNRYSAIIGDNMLYISDGTSQVGTDPTSARPSNSQHTSPHGSTSNSSTLNSEDEDEDGIEFLKPTVEHVATLRHGTAISHAVGSRKTREEPSERARSCEVNVRENRTFENPLGARPGYMSHKVKSNQSIMQGRSSVAAYRV